MEKQLNIDINSTVKLRIFGFYYQKRQCNQSIKIQLGTTVLYCDWLIAFVCWNGNQMFST